ncbi:MAG: ZIP family metal transporter [Oligoflexia bacterium]|nr:ZIP family metal transporter [Oligoflexia bacterium]
MDLTSQRALPLLLAFLSTLSTFAGGIFVLRSKLPLRLILSFSAGAILGVVLFDLFPEAFELTRQEHFEIWAAPAAAAGFAFYFLLSRLQKRIVKADSGDLGAASLVLHSVLDGITIGIGFKAGRAIGIAVALAVITHDFSDGINTVSIIMRARSQRKNRAVRAVRWLALDAVAPFIGALLASFLDISRLTLGIALAAVGGSLFYIATIELLPDVVRAPSRLLPLSFLFMGMLTLYAVIRLGAV